MSNFLDNPDKTCNFQLCWPIIPLAGGWEPGKEENWPYGIATRPSSLGKLIIGRDMNYHYSKTKLVGSIKVYPQRLVRIVVDKGEKVAQGLLNAFEKCRFLEGQHFKLHF